MSMPARWLNSSPARCEAEPAPVEAKSMLPGFFFDSATNSASVFAPTALFTTSTFGKLTPPDTGARSLNGS